MKQLILILVLALNTSVVFSQELDLSNFPVIQVVDSIPGVDTDKLHEQLKAPVKIEAVAAPAPVIEEIKLSDTDFEKVTDKNLDEMRRIRQEIIDMLKEIKEDNVPMKMTDDYVTRSEVTELIRQEVTKQLSVPQAQVPTQKQAAYSGFNLQPGERVISVGQPVTRTVPTVRNVQPQTFRFFPRR